jgi:zinc/manganese transport system permease protein
MMELFESLWAMRELLAAPLAICIILTGIHCYLGIHVVSRGVIFVDLSLAQVAALGTTIALLAGYEINSGISYLFSLGFTLVGAALFALWRYKDERIPQEALIGIVYAVATAAAILALDRSPHGHEEIKSMLVGSVLFVSWSGVLKTMSIYAAVALVHIYFRKQFFQISLEPEKARAEGRKIWFWDFIFYATFGLVVTSSVQIAGVLLVFSYLIVPAVIGMMFFKDILPRLLLGWGVGIVASTAGIASSALMDLPTGATIVATFGVVLVLAAVVRWLLTAVLGRSI